MNLARKYLPHYTVEDYRIWKGDWELIGGIPYAMAPSPVWKHQRVSGLIFLQIEKQMENCSENCRVCQEVDWIVSKDTVVRPDILVVCGEVEDYVKTTPRVIFEVVSKSTAFKDENLKFELYQKERVNYYALVYPDLKKMRVFKLKNSRYEKVFDSDNGNFLFDIETCRFTIDLTSVWKKI
ncbi:MAG: Uma2 family endonuclease [Desulfurobacterium sp.]|nr:MAG: Uma2 family endonuclease [Desulfurobacterium sp.]